MAYDATFATKFISPIIFLPLNVGGTAFIYVDVGPIWILATLPIHILYLFVFTKISLPAKRVEIIGDQIHITDFRRRQTVPLTQVANVENVWSGHPWARRIRFREPTDFGISIVYLPRYEYGMIQRDWPQFQNLPTS